MAKTIDVTTVSRFLWMGALASVKQIKAALDAKAAEFDLDAGDFTAYSAPDAATDPTATTVNTRSILDYIESVEMESEDSEDDADVTILGNLWVTAAARVA